jgi:hypothetical protein
MFNTSTTTKGSNIFTNIAKNAAATTTKALNTMGDMATDAAQSANKTITNMAKNIPVVNSLLPFGNVKTNSTTTTALTNAVKNTANAATNVAKNTANALANAANNAFENIMPNLAPSGPAAWPWWVWALSAFVVVAIVVSIVLTVYKDQVQEAWDRIKSALKIGKKPAALAPAAPAAPAPAPATQDTGAGAQPSLMAEATGLISKILPGKKEVFNVSSNEFTYYDAEPMCRALGAELATYDQVKDAWGKGADWCNYGWAKGQMAVYPTQKTTYDTLQSGPPEDQGACGTPGVNGGFFDNPEMRFGVNCYGVKPAQTANDERMLQEKGLLPRSTATLKVDQQAQEYKERLASIGVLPFNGNAWTA